MCAAAPHAAQYLSGDAMTPIANQLIDTAARAAEFHEGPHIPAGKPSPAWPPSPRTVADTRLPQQVLVELIAKTMYEAGNSSLEMLTQKLKLPAPVVIELLDFMVYERLLQVLRRGERYFEIEYQLTEAGRQRAAAFLLHNRYTGPAPVTLDAYREMVARQSVRFNRITEAELDGALAGLVVSSTLRDQLGSAINCGRSLFLSGPPGSGKSTLALKLASLMRGPILLPYAVLVDHAIIVLYDPLLHRPLPAGQAAGAAPAAADTSYLRDSGGGDQRWLLCQRPVVHGGGELTLAMLNLQHDASLGYYQAPPQFKANNGLFIIDDLGSQQTPVRDLLNRWLAPLDRGCDQLSLHTGYQFSAPFDVTLVFAASSKPAQVADATFMRRMVYKIELGALSESQYRTLTRDQCAALGIAFDETAFRHLVGYLHRSSGRPRLAVYPRDLLTLIADQARFLHQSPAMTAPALERAWHSYFAGGGDADLMALTIEGDADPLRAVRRESVL
jgi:energy-coupling factor transporter ATP-binding protein EcfA2